MNKTLFCLLSAIWILLQIGPSNIFGGQVVAPSNDKIEFLQVAVPTDMTYHCDAPAWKPICVTFNSMVALNDPRVDAVLTLNKIRVTNTSGNIIFPRPTAGGGTPGN